VKGQFNLAIIARKVSARSCRGRLIPLASNKHDLSLVAGRFNRTLRANATPFSLSGPHITPVANTRTRELASIASSC
jgi:hypothetical protein